DVAVAAHDVLLSTPAAVGDHAVHDALGPGASSLTALLAGLLGLLLTALVVTLLGLLGALVDRPLVGVQIFENFFQVLAHGLFSEVVLGVQLFEQILQVGDLGVLDTGPLGHDLDPILINLVRGFAGQVLVGRLGLVGDLVAIGVLVLDLGLLDGVPDFGVEVGNLVGDLAVRVGQRVELVTKVAQRHPPWRRVVWVR